MNKDGPSYSTVAVQATDNVLFILTDIDGSEQSESNPHVDHEQDRLYDAHDQELEGVELADDHSEGDEGTGGGQASLQDTGDGEFQLKITQYLSNLMKLMGMMYSPGSSLLHPNRRMANSVMVAVMIMVKLMALYP